MPKTVSFTFYVFSLRSTEQMYYVPGIGAEPMPLKFYSAYLSPAYRYQGPRLVRFYANKDVEHSLPIAEWETPNEPMPVVLLFESDEITGRDNIKYRVIAIEDSAKNLSPGHFAICNLTGREFDGEYDDDQFVVGSGLGYAREGRQHGLLKLFAAAEGRKIQVATYGFQVAPDDRVLILLFPSRKRGSLVPIIRKLTE